MIESAFSLLTSKDVVVGLIGLGVLLVFPRWWLLALLSAGYGCLLSLLAVTAEDSLIGYTSWLIAQTLIPSFTVLGIFIVVTRKWFRSRKQATPANA